MRLKICGRDRSADLGVTLGKRAEGYMAADPGLSALLGREQQLAMPCQAGDGDDYLGRHIDLNRSRNCVETAGFEPVKGGMLLPALLRKLAWRFLRCFLDWFAFRQNSINVQMSYEIEFLHEQLKARNDELERRVRALEDKLAGCAGEDVE